jgi:hypothetical protein
MDLSTVSKFTKQILRKLKTGALRDAGSPIYVGLVDLQNIYLRLIILPVAPVRKKTVWKLPVCEKIHA